MVCNCPNSQTSTATSGFADRPLVLAFSRVPVSQSTLARCDHGQARGLRFNPCGFNYLPLVVRSTPRKHADTECLDITPAIRTCLFLSAITQSSFVQAQDRAPEPRDMPRLACTVFSPPHRRTFEPDKVPYVSYSSIHPDGPRIRLLDTAVSSTIPQSHLRSQKVGP